MINFKVGIMGAGAIASTIADTLNKLDAFEPYAIASRDIEKANAFGDKYNVTKRYGSYEALAADPDVELIYIATPHSHHAEQAKMCIEAGKPVLVEKAFSYNAATTEEVLKLSEKKNIFAGEAMWIRFMPMYQALADYVRKGAIGQINNITCSLGYDLRHKERVVKPELGGGALLDLGVYPLNFITMMYGKPPATLASTCMKLETGVDAQEVLQINFNGGQSATAFVTMMYKADNGARLYGSKGYIEIDNINCPEEVRIYSGDGQLVSDVKKPERQISGYEYEFIAARDAIILGKYECEEMPHAQSIHIMQLADSLRKSWKITFPMENASADTQA